MIVELPTWTGASLEVSNTPVKLSRTPGGPTTGAARPGEHTRDILTAAGFTDAELDALEDRRVIATGPAEA
jgi:crotonobetainyl-CoA:carnitine CoA-transferase CaiB-like acyl-CoA transferase